MSADHRKTASAGASFFVGVFTKNLPTKIAAFILAILVWFTVRLELMEPQKATMRLELDFEEGLMLAGDSPPKVMVELEGPRPDIAAFEKITEPVLSLRILGSDLRELLEAQLEFGLDNDDLDRFRMPFESDIRVKRVYVSKEGGSWPISVKIAVRTEAEVAVVMPKLEGLPDEWEPRIELLTPTVRVEGPAGWFTANDKVAADSIHVTSILANRQDQDEVQVSERSLDLDPALAEVFVRLARGQHIRYRGSFRKSKVTEDIPVPFRSDILKKEDGGYSLLLTFTGTPSDLEKLKQAVADGGVYAYVLAEDFGPYREEGVEEARDYVQPVRVEIHSDIFTDLATRVGFEQPSSSVGLEMKKR